MTSGVQVHPFQHLLLGVCGSSAATAVDQLVSDATQQAEQVTVVATPAAAALFLPSLTSLPARLCTDADWTPQRPLHVTLAETTDVLIVAPATATTLSKAAAGLADTLLTAVILTYGPGVYFWPCMNRRMWDNPATIRNVAALREAGHYVLEPVPGASLTSDTIGTGIGEIPGGVLAGVAAHTGLRRQDE